MGFNGGLIFFNFVIIISFFCRSNTETQDNTRRIALSCVVLRSSVNAVLATCEACILTFSLKAANIELCG